MERPSTRDGSSTPAPSTPSPSKRASTFAAEIMAPFDPVSSERLNKQLGSEQRLSLNSLGSPTKKGHSRDSSVSDKINQFNTLASQSKHLERKNADAALKRAMLGREEAEAEVRKYRDDVQKYKDEVRALKKELEEGRVRERKVGERLETVMENYGRTKETHAHTQTLWEKEIRRMRKETFKSQSAIVDLQEQLNAARAAQKLAEASLEREKERSAAREQEAFQARYNQVGLQEQLEKIRSELNQALERVKLVEQERDAFKTLAKTEEDVARIASEGRLPLPPASQEDEEDEFASPRKSNDSRAVSLSLIDIKSSAASEMEIEELTRLWQWEKQRADRAADQVEYLEAECSLRACSCMKKRPRSSMMGLLSPKRQKRAAAEPLPPLADPSDRMILSEKATTIPPPNETSAHAVKQPTKKKTNRSDDSGDRRATIFLPDLGTFRTVSMEEADAMERTKEQQKRDEPVLESTEPDDKPMKDAPAHVEKDAEPERYSRTPSVEPPSFAILGQERSSLVSLLDAPHHQEQPVEFKIPSIPTTPGLVSEQTRKAATGALQQSGATSQAETRPNQPRRLPLGSQDPNVDISTAAFSFKTSYNSRPHTTQSFYTSTTTTSVPLREENSDPSMAKKLLALQRTPSRGRVGDNEAPTWDVNNPALTPTMTREEALAKIRERRGRAKSGNAGTATPYKGMIKGARGDRRNVSAPAGRKGRVGS
ncbi:hypothetical protein J7T55_015790 [Diaporthe amygdali]|uniref:uncharacterized protein n=1 Tax=Phomopsis amygdali TaxID=1214568 RepID=UPI0022FDB390|nr:uncharacterized protein J7T55_015790 [Diaporthe amygdali]KAJ0107324.1 hypothetical protein J7T55_015790 [Diaporthe amygdali]